MQIFEWVLRPRVSLLFLLFFHVRKENDDCILISSEHVAFLFVFDHSAVLNDFLFEGNLGMLYHQTE